MPDLEALGFHIVGYGCTTCIGNSGPLPDAGREGGRTRATSSSRRCSRGNRNFEGRINPRREGELPGQAAAGRRLRAGRHDRHRPRERAARHGHGRHSRCTSQTSGRRQQEVREAIDAVACSPRCSSSSTRNVFDGNPKLERDPGRRAASCTTGTTSQHLHPGAAVLRRTCTPRADAARPTSRARACWRCSATRVTTDHISPAGRHRQGQPGRAAT